MPSIFASARSLHDLCPRFNWEPPLFPTALAIRPGEPACSRKNTTTNHSDGSSTLLLIRHATVSGSNITSTTCLSYLQHGKFGVRVCVKLDNGPTHPYIMPRMFIKIYGRAPRHPRRSPGGRNVSFPKTNKRVHYKKFATRQVATKLM